MAFDPARPRYTLPLAGKDYELLGTFELIEAVENATGMGIVSATVALINDMPTGTLAKLLAAVLNVSGHKTTTTESREILWNHVGITGDDNTRLRLHLYSFLNICLANPDEREAKAKTAGELMGKLKPASRGKNTKSSA